MMMMSSLGGGGGESGGGGVGGGGGGRFMTYLSSLSVPLSAPQSLNFSGGLRSQSSLFVEQDKYLSELLAERHKLTTLAADGDEGGKHQLITATVNGGKLYICKAQAGDKRWFKGARKFIKNAATSFSVA